MTRKEKALALREKGYNCCQCTVCVFADEFGEDHRTVFKAAEGLGSGMGGMEGACGAVSGAIMALGLKNSTCNLEAPDSKAATCKLSKQLFEEFQKKNGSVICKALKGTESGTPLRSCPDCIGDAIALVEDILGLEK